MNILVTAGNTQTPIDKVRCITNIFTGRTGASIALEAHRRGHHVTLLTSHPEVVADLKPPQSLAQGWTVRVYRTFDDLHAAMAELVRTPSLDAVIHSAAVSDYRAAGIFAPANDTLFSEPGYHWESMTAEPPRLVDVSAGKVKSDAPELWLRLQRTPKLVDFIRKDWGFAGVLVKFKLEVDVTDEHLLQVAEKSRVQSGADLIVANTLHGATLWAFLGPLADGFHRLARWTLAERLLEEVERLHQERNHG
jgi:phosphopantothenoylcysteine synthetase/decarboxylase